MADASGLFLSNRIATGGAPHNARKDVPSGAFPVAGASSGRRRGIALAGFLRTEPRFDTATSSCRYDRVNKTVAIKVAPEGTASTLVSDGKILWSPGGRYEPCSVATTTNTDRIKVSGDARYFAILDAQDYRPGFSREKIGVSESESTLEFPALGTEVQISSNEDEPAAFNIGRGLMNVNFDGDADIAFSGIDVGLRVSGGDGGDRIDARGGKGTGAPYRIDGGPGVHDAAKIDCDLGERDVVAGTESITCGEGG
jgi:hypothetical protein